MKNLTQKNKNGLFLSIFGLIILVMVYFQNQKEISLSINKEMTIGKVTNLHICSKTPTRCIDFKYLVDGKWVEGSDRGDALWPKFIRESKPQIGRYYPVEYDKKNIDYSKIQITVKPLSNEQAEKYINEHLR